MVPCPGLVPLHLACFPKGNEAGERCCCCCDAPKKLQETSSASHIVTYLHMHIKLHSCCCFATLLACWLFMLLLNIRIPQLLRLLRHDAAAYF
eukprot:Transcript_27600.p4 GENE.Transcript_27600~~Transcript_27600.p4  ORF type:complete len:93 (+),score=8.55 Transcript_27600:755-1033(+)